MLKSAKVNRSKVYKVQLRKGCAIFHGKGAYEWPEACHPRRGQFTKSPGRVGDNNEATISFTARFHTGTFEYWELRAVGYGGSRLDLTKDQVPPKSWGHGPIRVPVSQEHGLLFLEEVDLQSMNISPVKSTRVSSHQPRIRTYILNSRPDNKVDILDVEKGETSTHEQIVVRVPIMPSTLEGHPGLQAMGILVQEDVKGVPLWIIS